MRFLRRQAGDTFSGEEPLCGDVLQGVGDGCGRMTGLCRRAGSCGSLNGNLDKLMDVLGATPATPATLEIEFGLELAGHHKSGASSLADIRFGNSVAEAHVHGRLLADDYEKHSQYRPCLEFCQPTERGGKRNLIANSLLTTLASSSSS